MARSLFNLDAQVLSGFTMLVQSERGGGKTHLIGDALRHEKQFGPVRYLNIAGEDGGLTLAGMGLGESGVTIDTWEDFLEEMKELAAHPVQALGLDSLYALFERIVFKQTKGAVPRIPSADEMKRGVENDWPQIYNLLKLVGPALRRASKYVIAACPSDTTRDPMALDGGVRPTHIGPDLPKGATNIIIGAFDFGGIIRLDVRGPESVTRSVSFMKDNRTVGLRQRIPNEITKAIVLPKEGGWLAIKTAIETGAKGKA